ncbi:transmembrane amino acid transporter protein-domain-containing protein [Penicillium psychrosexuale]|uniref:transmembrane amino acid transporter protein-domain-containing protein n=1 Tax=Penicillium psychrosexuale TaxID=1002107 RepID=UPI0025458376|nr:transmembrane amino acid transporter protein-domain-containing protein [Penicillium psychrosexuale]KAJ5789535.1 transmembrane amino acid transporter protein-domain-containing protein [Penicillium psychrosexuale]
MSHVSSTEMKLSNKEDHEQPMTEHVGWIGSNVIMMKTQIGLGVLAIPAAFDKLGIVPGVICLCAVGAITTWSDYMVGDFKRPSSPGLRAGRCGCLDVWPHRSGVLRTYVLFINHGACTAVFVVVAAIIGFFCSSICTLGRISWLAWVGLSTFLTAILIVTIAVAVQERPAAAPQDGVWISDYKIVNNPSFTDAVSAVSTMVLAYCGTPAFFNIIAEMRDPRRYNRSLFIAQGGVSGVYILIGCMVYYYCGSYVASPALGSAGGTVKRISYGIALPGLLVSITITSHISAKFFFIRLLRGTQHLTSNSFIHWGTWLGCTLGVTLVAYVIASAIPVFDSLVSLVGALLGTLISFQPYGCMWLYDNWHSGKAKPSFKWALGVAWALIVILSGTFLTIAGTYGAAVNIVKSYSEDGGSSPWSCADNSNSV